MHYRNGHFALTGAECTAEAGGIDLPIGAPQGDRTAPLPDRTYVIQVRGAIRPRGVGLDGASLPTGVWEHKGDFVSIPVSRLPAEVVIDR